MQPEDNNEDGNVNMPEKGRGFMRLVRAMGYSMDGFKSCFKHEAAFRQEVFLAILLIPAAFWIGQNLIHTVLLIGSMIFLMIVELLNSAIEWNVDLATKERHLFAKHAKDMASAAVLLAIINLAAFWLSAIYLFFFGK